MSKKPGSSHEKNIKRNNKDIYGDIKKGEKRYLKERSAYLDAISDSIFTSADIVRGMPVMTMHGRNTLLVENQKRVLEYTDSCIRVQTSSFVIVVDGSAMKINYCTGDELKITGIIHSVSFK